MGYEPAFASVQLMLFEGTCYLTPILGAWLADSAWGRFKTILVFSIVYFLVCSHRVACHNPFTHRQGRCCSLWHTLGFVALAASGTRSLVSATGWLACTNDRLTCICSQHRSRTPHVESALSVCAWHVLGARHRAIRARARCAGNGAVDRQRMAAGPDARAGGWNSEVVAGGDALRRPVHCCAGHWRCACQQTRLPTAAGCRCEPGCAPRMA